MPKLFNLLKEKTVVCPAFCKKPFRLNSASSLFSYLPISTHTGDVNMPKLSDWMLNSTTQTNTRLRRRIRNEKNRTYFYPFLPTHVNVRQYLLTSEMSIFTFLVQQKKFSNKITKLKIFLFFSKKIRLRRSPLAFLVLFRIYLVRQLFLNRQYLTD